LQWGGYDWNAWKLNAADYGVAQTRKRMIVAARRGGPRPKKPPATHAEDPPSGGLFGGELNEWVGWYEAVEDLIPDLPETELADWQKERLLDELIESRFVSSGNTWGLDALKGQPALTLQGAQSGYKAVLVHGSDTRSCPQQDSDELSFPVIANGNQKGAGANVLRAVLVHGQQTNPAPSGKREDRTAITKGDDEPTFSINATAYKGTGRAILIGDNANASSGSKIHRNSDEPCLTVRKSTGGSNLKGVTRRVVQMTPRCLARFQSFPDDYELPDSKSLACRIIGNAVPPLAMKKWVEAWIE